MDFENYNEQLRLSEEYNNQIFSSIKFLFQDQNDNILLALHSKGFNKISPADLKKCGFNVRVLVYSDSRSENPLLGKITYNSLNHFIGFDLVLENSQWEIFKIIKTNNTEHRAELLIKIRNKEFEINSLENTAAMWASGEEGCPDIDNRNYYMDLANNAKLELNILKSELYLQSSNSVKVKSGDEKTTLKTGSLLKIHKSKKSN
jgi:hypothetical protein